MKKESYIEIINRYQKDMALLSQIGSLLNWDEETYMPKDGLNSRAEEMAFVSKLLHEKITSNELYEALNRLRKKKLKGDEEIIVRRLYKSVSRSRKLPKSYIEELSKTVTIATAMWRKSREKEDFKIFQPYLEKIVKLKQQEVKYVGVKGHPYNSLLDEYEEGMTAEKLKPLFAKLKADLRLLLNDIESSERYKNQKIKMMAGKFDRDEKIKLSLDVIKRMGLKNENSRLDLVEHPMTIKVGFNDVRITTGVREDPMFTFGSTVHEAGHALYDLGMREKDKYTVLSDAPSLGMHESQSRFWEIMMSLNKPFWRFYFPKFKKAFNLNGNYDEWYKEVNFIEPSFVRIESDEVHYCLHIILRFEIEMGLIDGSIKVKDLPKIWNSKTKELFGIIPHSDKKGVLQDVHWSNGYIGYFPTYAIGTIYSTQLYSQMKKEIPEIEKDIEKGDFSKVKNWLDEKVHKYGSRYLAEDLMKKVCGEGLNPEVFINYLKEKYSEIYK